MFPATLKKIRRWYQIRTGRYETPFDGEIPFWTFSFCIQFVLLAVAAKILIPSISNRNEVVVIGEQQDVIEIADIEQPELEFNDIDIDQLNNDPDVQLEIIADTESPLFEISAPAMDLESALNEPAEFLTDADLTTTESTFSKLNTTGSAGHAATKASGAVDRLTQEILASLEDNATLLVWLFDQSASLTRQREEIEDRIDRIYRELNLLEESGASEFKDKEDIPLLTQVFAFGQQISPIMDAPTGNVERIKSAIASIQRDTSGIENVFSAIIHCVREFRSLRKS